MFKGVPFSPDKRWLVIGSMNPLAKTSANSGGAAPPAGEKRIEGGCLLWDVVTQKPVAELGGQPAVLLQSAFTPDSELVAVVDMEGTLRFHDTKTSGEAFRYTDRPTFKSFSSTV